MVMDSKSTKVDQEPATTPEQTKPVTHTPVVLSDLNDIQDVENEKPPVPPLKFNTIADGVTTNTPSSKWRYGFIVISVLQIIAIALVLQAMVTAAQKTGNGETGAEIGILYAYLMFGLPGALLGAINLISLPIYLMKTKPHGVWLGLGVASIIISFVTIILAIRAFSI